MTDIEQSLVIHTDYDMSLNIGELRLSPKARRLRLSFANDDHLIWECRIVNTRSVPEEYKVALKGFKIITTPKTDPRTSDPDLDVHLAVWKHESPLMSIDINSYVFLQPLKTIYRTTNVDHDLGLYFGDPASDFVLVPASGEDFGVNVGGWVNSTDGPGCSLGRQEIRCVGEKEIQIEGRGEDGAGPGSGIWQATFQVTVTKWKNVQAH